MRKFLFDFYKIKFGLVLFFSLLSSINPIFCQINQWEVTTLVEPSAGYIKFDHDGNENFYLYDNYGEKVYLDTSATLKGANYCKILSNGYWSVYKNSKYHIYDQNMNFIETINYTGSYYIDIHDMNILPNGHYILIGVENRTMDLSKIVDGGNENATVIGAHLLEVDKDGNIYWTWSSFDHFSILDITPEIDLTQPIVPFTHANSVTTDLDGNILLSCRNLDEITKINKSTGEIIWRMGGSACKNNEFIFLNDTIEGFFGFSHQHSLVVLPNGNFLLYDNGTMKPNQYSRAVEYSVNQNTKEVTKVWECNEESFSYYSSKGSVQRLENGNTLINWGEDKITEVRPDNSIAFEMRSKVYFPVYRAFRYVTKMDAVGKNITTIGNYNFNNEKFKTDISINVQSLTGQSYSMIEKHYYLPTRQSFSVNSFSEILPYRWVFSKRGITSIKGEISINLDSIKYNGDKRKLTIYGRTSEAMGVFNELITEYDENSNIIKADFNTIGEFIIGSNELSKPTLITPINNSYLPFQDGVLRWDKVKGATNYKVQVSKDNNFQNKVIDTNINDSDFLNYKILEIKTKYYWRVSALNKKDTSEWSDIYSFETKIGPPSLLEPENEKRGLDKKVSFKWDKVSDLSTYWIQIAKQEEFSDIYYENKDISNTFFEYSVDENYRVYYWRVCAIEGIDTSKWSLVNSFVTKMAPPEIITPYDKQINMPLTGIINWSEVNGASGYHIQISENNNFANNIIDEQVPSNSYNYTNLLQYKNYWVRVKAFNSLDSSNWSKAINFTTKLSKPKLLSPFNHSDEVEIIAEFEWLPVDSAENYHLQLAYNDKFDSILNEDDNIQNTKYNKFTLPKSLQVYWRVKAFKGEGESDWSDVWTFTTETGLYLATPLLITPADKSTDVENEGTLTWKRVNDAEAYILWVSKSDSFEDLVINDSNILQGNYNYKDLEYDSTYFWVVKAYNSLKESRWSKVFSFKVKSTDNVKEFFDDGNLLIYPQPASFFVFINNHDFSNDANVEIYNQMGVRELTFNLNFSPDRIYHLNTERLNSGLYFIKISDGDKITINKLVIMK